MQASAPIGARYAGRRAYMLVDNDELQTREEKETQTDLTTAAKTRFVTPRPILSNSEAAASSYALAFHNLRERIRSPALKHSLLIVLGHDPDKRRDEVDRRICEDAAAEALDGELRDFFDAVLAPVMQERETTLVNTMQDCIQHELQSQQFIVHNQEKRIAVLTQQVEDWEKQVTHLKAKVDRRVNENNALRKEQYRQLLMLRDIVSKQSSEPGALSALNEAIATVLAGKQEKLESETPRNGGDNDQNKAPGRGWGAGNANTQVLHREKEKWEQRAREANAECQELRDRIAHLTQENAKYRASVADPWFLNPENAIVERQRIAEAVCASQGSWEDVGDSLVELLNNDILWAAVEQSVRRGGTQGLARGLESMFAQLNGLAQSPSIDDDDVSDNDEVTATPPPARRRSAYADLGRLIPCRVCNGAGYIQTELGDNATNDADSYLRKTLEQVLELKKQLENANTKAFTLEGQLQLSHKETAELQEILQQAEFIKSSAVDSCLQTDLDTEEGIDIDEIMHSAYGDGTPTGQSFPRRNRRNSQYEHLIVELKSTLADKDEGLAESRKALDVAHSRAVTLQRALQKEKDSHAQELGMLKTSLAFSLKTRNTKIEERQAAVKLLLKKFSKKQQPLTIPKNISALAPMDEAPGEDNDEASTEQNESGSTVQNIASYEPNNEQPEVRRMETLVQRYAEDIIRVRKEHEIQQELLKKAEAHIAEEDEKRSRTNSISQGSLVVNLASHPRDLFKALTTAQGDMLKLRRASHRSSTLQTDRLLTLTTHLGHMSEELCTLRKRNLAELEFWKLECEKLQNTNKALEAELQLNQQQLQTARQSEIGEDALSKTCWLCEKHKTRLMSISNQLLNQAQTPRTDPELEVPVPLTLTESEQKNISSILLDLESIYSGMTASKKQLAHKLVAAHLGSELNPRSTRSTNGRSDLRSNTQDGSRGDGSPVAKTTSISPRRSSVGIEYSKSKAQMKKSVENSAAEQQSSDNPTQTLVVPPNASDQNSDSVVANSEPSTQAAKTEGFSPSHRRKTVVKEILDEGGFLLTKYGLPMDSQGAEVPVVDIASEKPGDNNAEMSTSNPALYSSNTTTSPRTRNEPQDAPSLESEDDHFQYETGIPLLDDSNNIERDPEVIEQLRLLINQSSATKENLAITGWKILVCRILSLWDLQRLDRMKKIADKQAKVQSDGKARVESRKSSDMRGAMQKRVQLREKSLQDATSTQEILRKERKKAQAHLIHTVSTLLTNLSRNGKPMTPSTWQTDELREVLYVPQPGSPRRSPTSNRPLYPSAKVHMNHLPLTQQIPTSTFPALTTRSPSSGFSLGQQIRPSSSRYHEKSADSSSQSDSGGYQLPHRLIKSAGPRSMVPFLPIHSTISALQGSIPFPDPARIRDLKEVGGSVMNWEASNPSHGAPRPVRPHSSPAGPRFVSPRTQEIISLASTLDVVDTADANSS